MKQVVIILVNWNGWRDTVECLQSLLKLDYPDFRIVICDNESCDDSLSQIGRWADSHAISYAIYQRNEAEVGGKTDCDPLLVLIQNGQNLGFAGGNNVGLRYALARRHTDYCWLLNNDTVVEADSLTKLVQRIQADQTVGICGSTILYYYDHSRVQALGGGWYFRWFGIPWHYGRFSRFPGDADRQMIESRMNYVEGASMLVSRSFVEQVGLMCEDYFLYFEEADWALRAKGRFKLGYAPKSVIYHKIGSSIGTSSNPARKSDVCDYYNIRNRILFTWRFFPYALPTVYIVLVAEIVLRLFLGRWDRAIMIMGLMKRGLSNRAAL